MKIAVVGCGAVGSYYGAQLCRAGHSVHFLLRSDYEVVRQAGVRIRSIKGDFFAHPNCASVAEEIGPSDLVLIALKTTANGQFKSLVSPLVGPQTAVMTLQNGLGNEEQLATVVHPNQILGGLCFVCLNRIGPGHIDHLDHGRVVVGEFEGGPKSRTNEIASHFRAAGVPCDVAADLRQAHWEKLVWNIPFNGLGVAGVAGFEATIHGTLSPGWKAAGVLTTDKLLGDSRWCQLSRELMLEVIHAAKALGMTVDESIAENQISLTRTMGAYKASTLLDFEHGKPLELQSLFLEPLRQALSAGAAVPRLEKLCRILTALNPG